MDRYVAFTLNKRETRATLDYKEKNSRIDVEILTPDISSQVELENNKLGSFSYFDHKYYQDEYLFSQSFWVQEKKAVDLSNKMLDYLSHSFPDDRIFLSPFQSWLEMAYLGILETFRFYQSVNKRWHPNKYVFSQKYDQKNLSLYSPFENQLDILSNFFIAPNKKMFISMPRVFQHKKRNESSFSFSPLKNPDTFSVLLTRSLANFFTVKLKSEKKDIIVFSAGKGLLTYQEVLELLLNKGYRLQIVTSSQSVEDEVLLKKSRLPYVPLSAFSNKTIEENALGKTNQLLPLVNKKVQQLKSNCILSSYPPPIRRAIIEKTLLVIGSQLKKIIGQTLLAKLVLNTYTPNLIITTHDPGPTAMPFVLSAKKMNIRTLVFMHGWQDTMLGVRHQSDKIAVWSSYIADWYENRLQYPRKSIASLGYPLFDTIIHEEKAFWQKNVEVRTLPVQATIGILLTMYFPNTALIGKFLYEFFSKFSMNNNQYQLRIRLHPGQPTEGIKDLANYFGIQVEINKKENLEDFLSKSDVVLTWDTTAMFWAMFYGKPLFYSSPSWTEGITPVKKWGGAWLTKSPADVLSKIQLLQKDTRALIQLQKQQVRFLKKIVGVIDGTSSVKHLSYIERLLANK